MPEATAIRSLLESRSVARHACGYTAAGVSTWLRCNSMVAVPSAATTVLTQLVGHPLHADYQRRLQAGIKPNLAKLTLARRIAAIVLSMWKHEEVYDPARLKVVTNKS